MSQYMCSRSQSLGFASLLLIISLGQIFAEKYPGDSCYLRNGRIGICKRILECASALESLSKNINPIQCGFEGPMSIVCCKKVVVTTTTPRSLHPRRFTEPGQVSAEKCKEYSKWVRRKILEVGFTFDTEDKYESTCKLESGTGFIIGGKNASLEEFPHAVAIGYGDNPNMEWKCAGSLIAEQWVLTAAHCNSATGLGNASYARIGFVNFNTDSGITIPIIQRIKYPNYTRAGYHNDISLMKLAAPLNFSTSLRPACLRYKPTITDKQVFAAGWGFTQWNVEKLSDILQKVQLNIYDKPICDESFSGDPKFINGFNEDLQLCIGELEGGKDTCRGDSGGAVTVVNPDVYCMFDIVGVTGAGSRFCGSLKSASLYTRVSHYIDWIEKIVWPEFFQ